ncbi:ankyrin repeat-containing protein BDA1-like [Rhodamnia argentea]|uniref:Ankyrin repeat-containing protein BDA1-like n=1 Tax=Rhodamnia argentea TaxID=178133 RepID=A0ABM3HW22_9MYRT|nr:ankyrin repeat-containing protein BDA1-like [Rhodamnia argentea]
MDRRLYKAAAEGDAASLLDLLRDDPLILDRCLVWSYNETPLHVAAMLGHEKFVGEILDRKPELAGELDSQKFSPLHLATAKGHLGVVKKLLTVNADVCYARDKYGRNPLHIAAVKGRVDALKELVRERPDAARQRMEHGETILHLCVKHNNVEALKLLVESVGDDEFVNLKNDDGDTVLHLAAADRQTEEIGRKERIFRLRGHAPRPRLMRMPYHVSSLSTLYVNLQWLKFYKSRRYAGFACYSVKQPQNCSMPILDNLQDFLAMLSVKV